MIHRLIFRLDYPISYQLIDNLGKVSDFVYKAFDGLPDVQKEVNLDINKRRIDASASKKDESGIKLTVELQSLHGSIDFKDSVPTTEIRKHFGVKIIHDVIDILGLESLEYFNRFGIRCLFLVENKKFTFETINTYILKQEKILSKSFFACKFSPEDSMIRIVGAKDIYGLGVSFGPYKKEEAARHFLISPSVSEALILDIDLFTVKFQSTKLDFRAKLEIYLQEIDILLKSITGNLEKELNV